MSWDQLNNLLARDTFLNSELIGAEPLTLWPRANQADKVEFSGIWDEAGIAGSNEASGDGRTLDRATGLKDRKSMTIEAGTDHPDVLEAKIAGTAIPTGLKWFSRTQNPNRPDTVIRNSTGEMVQIKRIIGSDDHLTSYLGIKMTKVYTREGGITG